MSATPTDRSRQHGTEDLAMDIVTLYTDGGCVPNPGAGGYGAVVISEHQREELSGGFQWTTNNRMELFAAIAGLESLNMPSQVKLVSDSRYLVDAMTQGWAKRWRDKGWQRTPREKAINADLWARLLTLCEVHDVHFQWIKGHAGHEMNERCDALAMAALKRPGLPADEGYASELGSSYGPEASTTRTPACSPGAASVSAPASGARVRPPQATVQMELELS